MKRMKLSISKARLVHAVLFLLLLVMALFWVLPVWFAMITSFKFEKEIFGDALTWLPREPTLYNFDYLFSTRTNINIPRWFWNSLFIAITHTALVLLIDSLAAYAYGRMRFRGRTALFTTLMGTMMIPGIINFIPNFVIVNWLGWLDRPWAMIFPGLSGVFGIFLLRQFFMAIPREIDESAKVDGASDFMIYSRLIVPLAMPAMIALAILTFMGSWNDYLWPLIVTNRDNSKTLTVGVATLFSRYKMQKGVTLAGTVLGAVPPLLFFIFGQRYFIQGLSFAAVKE